MFQLAEFGDMTLGSVLRLRCKISGYSDCGHQITLRNLPKSHQICCHLTLRSLTKFSFQNDKMTRSTTRCWRGAVGCSVSVPWLPPKLVSVRKAMINNESLEYLNFRQPYTWPIHGPYMCDSSLWYATKATTRNCFPHLFLPENLLLWSSPKIQTLLKWAISIPIGLEMSQVPWGEAMLGTVLFLPRVVICNPQVANAALDAERPLPEAEGTVLIQICCIFSISHGLLKPVSLWKWWW